MISGESDLSEQSVKREPSLDENNNPYQYQIVWHKAVFVTFIHLVALYGVYTFISGHDSPLALLFFAAVGISGSMGVQCGAHRLWSHRCYKAKLPLRILLMVLNTLAFQEDVIDWSRDHRGHHKHSDTDADPYNSSRGFFFCHMGWVYVKKHPDVIKCGKQIDISDLRADPVLTFQRRYYYPLVALIWGALPTVTAMYLFNLSFISAFGGNALRYVSSLHLTWTVNSVAHLYGTRQYDKSINPRNSPLVMYWGLGEGYHNYHHVFPYDYSASEFGWKTNWNPATAFIDFFAWLGWAYDLKRAPESTVKSRTERSGNIDSYRDSLNIYYPFEIVLGLFATFLLPMCLLALRALF